MILDDQWGRGALISVWTFQMSSRWISPLNSPIHIEAVFDQFFIIIGVSMYVKMVYDVIIFLFAWFVDAIQTMVFTYYTHLVLILSASVKMMQSQLIRQITSVGQFRPKLSKYSITSGLMFTATLWVSDPIWSSNSQRNDLFWTDSVFDLLKKNLWNLLF